jgi:hypothetical protein
MSLGNPSGPKPLNINLANRNPAIYAASLAGQWNPDEKFVINNIQQLLDKDKQLSQNVDLSSARKQFNKLDPEIQGALVFINPDAEYQIADKSLLSSAASYLGDAVLDVFKAPFRFVGAVADRFYSLLPSEGPYRVYRSVTDKGDDKTAFQKLISVKNFMDGFNDINQWDSGATKKLEEKYGKATTFLAKGLLDGNKPSDILRSYGELDYDMANAIAQLSGQTKEWKNAFAETNMS